MFFTKICAKCKQSKNTSLFKKYSRAFDGLWSYCRICDKIVKAESYKKNRESILAKQKEYRIKNRDTVNARSAKYRLNNKEDIKIKQKEIYQKQKADRLAKAREYYENNKDTIKQRVINYVKCNKGKVNSFKAKYRASKYHATPKWLTKDQLDAISNFYKEAKRRSEETGQVHHVDHIIPLQGETICGLHVPWNLQILTQSENCRKNNKLDWINEESNNLTS